MPTLLGSIAYNPIAQNTRDLYYLSDSMGGENFLTGQETKKAFTKAFTDSSTGSWLDGYHPFASDISTGKVNFTIVNNLPISQTTFPILAGHVGKTYLHDFYFRIHLIPSSIALGSVLSLQTKEVTLWNAYFIDKTLSSIINTGLPDLTLTSPVTIPHLLKPLEEVLFVISVPVQGTAKIDGNFTFNVETEAPVLAITGQRVLLWPFSPLVDFSENRQWLTDIIQSRAGEQRFALREVPRVSLEYNFLFRSTNEFATAKRLAREYVANPMAIPAWSDVIPLTNLVAGQVTITFNTTNIELFVKQPIVFWASWESFEVQEILSFTSTSITLKEPLKNNFTKCWASPVLIGFNDSEISITSNENYKKTGKINFTSVEILTSSAWTTEMFQTIPVLTTTSIVSRGIVNAFSREQETFDSVMGLLAREDIETYTREVSKIALRASSQTELYNLRRFFDFLKGKFTAFWLPSFQPDFTPIVSTLLITEINIKVVSTKASESPPKFIRIVGKDSLGNPSIESFAVAGVSTNTDNTDTITFTLAATKTIFNISQIQLLTKVRLDTDTITFDHKARKNVFINATVREILA